MIDEINVGASYQCEEPHGLTHKWKAKPREIIERCLKCNSHRITLKFKKPLKTSKGEICGINFFPQEDWP